MTHADRLRPRLESRQIPAADRYLGAQRRGLMNEAERKKYDEAEASGLLPRLRLVLQSFCAPIWWEIEALLHEYPLRVGRRDPHFSGPSAGVTLQG